jgi:hypothetical protein
MDSIVNIESMDEPTEPTPNIPADEAIPNACTNCDQPYDPVVIRAQLRMCDHSLCVSCCVQYQLYHGVACLRCHKEERVRRNTTGWAIPPNDTPERRALPDIEYYKDYNPPNPDNLRIVYVAFKSSETNDSLEERITKAILANQNLEREFEIYRGTREDDRSYERVDPTGSIHLGPSYATPTLAERKMFFMYAFRRWWWYCQDMARIMPIHYGKTEAETATWFAVHDQIRHYYQSQFGPDTTDIRLVVRPAEILTVEVPPRKR